MAIQHVNIPSAGCHEPKHITDALVTDAGKVITPSATTPGTSVLRLLKGTELDSDAELVGRVLVTDGAGGFVYEDKTSASGLGIAYTGLTVTNNATVVSVTAAVDPTFATASDYEKVQVFDAVSASPSKNFFIDEALGEITAPVDGVYRVDFWATVKASINTVVSAFNFGVAGVPSTARPVAVRMPNAGQLDEVQAHAYITLTAGDIVSMWVASNTTCDITVVNGRVSLELIEEL